MKSPFQRIVALALCFTLTLGAFAYRPSEAKAIAGVDDAVVIGALLSAFAGGCGLIFSNNGMTSGELAQSLTDKWNEFNESAENAASSFAAWLGFEDTSALLGALSFSGSKLVIPCAVARKLSEFTTWLVDCVYIPASDKASSISKRGPTVSFGSSTLRLQNITQSSDLTIRGDAIPLPLSFGVSERYSLADFGWYILVSAYGNEEDWNAGRGNYKVELFDSTGLLKLTFAGARSLRCYIGYDGNSDKMVFCWIYNNRWRSTYYESYVTWAQIFGQELNKSDSTFGVTQVPGDGIPDIADEAANATLSGVGDGTATSVEELLQKILAQLQANTLAPTLDLAGTGTGGNTGTDEDAKPYLPYIPQIFGKIKDLPGTLANIWESIKGIPAAIAEKIGAFFTTLWGWLQSIIDAITALPAAIAEKIGALFKPDEALLTEITDTFKGKFGFFSTLKQFGSDLFGMTPETEPPVIWVHLENAESKFGYNYGDKQKIFDMTWYQKYKASVDGLLSGFLWLGYLWLLFKRAPAILGGMQLSADDAPRSADMPDVLSSPRLGAGDGSTMYRGDGFTMRDKGGRSK